MHRLARRFVRHSGTAAVLVITLPVVFVSSHTLMADVPLLAAWVAATTLFIAGVDESRPRLAIAGSVLTLIASLISYAGFWSMAWGMLPFWLGPAGSPLEEFSIYEVIRKPHLRCETEKPWYRQRF